MLVVIAVCECEGHCSLCLDHSSWGINRELICAHVDYVYSNNCPFAVWDVDARTKGTTKRQLVDILLSFSVSYDEAFCLSSHNVTQKSTLY